MKLDKLRDKDGPEESAEAAETAEEIVDGQISLLDTGESGDAEKDEKAADAEKAGKPEKGAASEKDGSSEKAEESEKPEEGEAAEEEAGPEAAQDAEEGPEGADAETGESGDEKAAGAKKKARKAGGLKAGRSRKKAPRPARVRRDAPLWSVIVAAVVVVGLAAGSFVLRSGAEESLSKDEVDKAVRTAAATAQHISSWDYRTIESDTDQVLRETTGDFREAYEKSATTLLESAPEQEAVAVGLTSKAGVESVSKGQVKVLVFLNQQTTKKDADAHIEQHRILLTMVQKDGEWLASKLDILG